MARHNIRHLAVSALDGGISGIVSIRDLLRLRASTAIELGDDIDAAQTVAALGRAWAKLPAMAGSLLAEGIAARDIAAIVARELGALTRRAAILGEQRMESLGKGAAPCAYALLVLGSAGRGESLLAMDQDNALVFEEGAPDGLNDRWFAELGKHVADILHEVGVPYCPGGVMASRPAFRGSMAEWRGRFAFWVSRSTPEDLLSSDITFDFRAVHGALAMAATLRTEAWAEARHATPFLKLLAANGEGGEAAFTLFGGLRTDEQGRFDLKNVGLRKIVTAARVLALRHGVMRHATQDRIAGLMALDVGGDADFRLWDRAHGVILDAILRQQLADIAAGKPPSNGVDPKLLGKEGTRALKDALSSLSTIDDMVRSQLTGT
jgi:DNA polymerase-3 subunit epsilon/CBS domain-containing protein